MGLFWLFWYCYDDSIAEFLGVPNLGNVGVWWWLLLMIAFVTDNGAKIKYSKHVTRINTPRR